jgi:NAD(P)-dependent dehydrogenase (short-subunit alcohol dehydrogenase family)
VDRGLITGAASGIGAALAERLAAKGMRLALLDRVPAQAPGAVSRVADVRDAAAVTAAVDEMAAELGGLDLAFVNAGIANHGPAHLMDPQAAEDTLEVNLLGAWRTTRAALPHLIASRGHLLLNASLSAVILAPGLAAYAASKAGVEALGRAIRVEVAHHGVTVGMAYYGFLSTPLVEEVRGNDAYRALRDGVPRPFAKTYPLEPAIEATLRGIDRRARVVAYPGWIRGAMALRGLLDTRLMEVPLRGFGRRLEDGYRREAERVGVEAAARGPRERARL